MKQQFKIYLNGVQVGSVYKSSHGVWVAQPEWASYSCSFLTKEQAELELLLHADNQKNYAEGRGITVQ